MREPDTIVKNGRQYLVKIRHFESKYMWHGISELK